MIDDNDTVVFVSASELAALVARSPQRLSQLVSDLDGSEPNPTLPATSVLINGNPAWALAPAVSALMQAGYAVSEQLIKELTGKRSVPASTIPIGVNEATEIMGIPIGTFRTRSSRGRTAPVLFRFGQEKVWDLNALIADAGVRGFTINEAAAAKWRDRNSGAAGLAQREVVHVVVIRSTVPAALDDTAAAQKVGGFLRNALVLDEPSTTDGVRVFAVEIQSAR